MPVFGIHGEAVCPVLCVPVGDCILSRGEPFGAKQALLGFVLPRVSFRGFRGLERLDFAFGLEVFAGDGCTLRFEFEALVCPDGVGALAECGA